METKDSSLWSHPMDRQLIDRKDGTVRIGIVRNISNSVDTSGAPLYDVEIFKDGGYSKLTCKIVTSMGGTHNYEEYRVRPYYNNIQEVPESVAATMSYAYRAGDTVIVTSVGGDWREGIILGGINHPSRETKLTETVDYFKTFNGVDTIIKNDGTYQVLWNGRAVNDDLLNVPPDVAIGQKPPAPEYDPTLMGTFFGIDKNGSFTASDAAEQIISIKKDKKNIAIASGKNRIDVGASELVGEADSIGMSSVSKIIASTKDLEAFASGTVKVTSTDHTSIKAKTISIGNDQAELIDSLSKLIDAIGKLTAISPNGPCQPLEGTAQWPQVMQIKQALDSLKGGLEDSTDLSSVEVTDDDNFSEGN